MFDPGDSEASHRLSTHGGRRNRYEKNHSRNTDSVGHHGISWPQRSSPPWCIPGKTVEERAINGAKAYVKKHNLKNPTQTMLLSSLYKNSHAEIPVQQWEKLTGRQDQDSSQFGYTDIPAKIMAEAVAKTGKYDIFNDFPYVDAGRWRRGHFSSRSTPTWPWENPIYTGIPTGLLMQHEPIKENTTTGSFSTATTSPCSCARTS